MQYPDSLRVRPRLASAGLLLVTIALAGCQKIELERAGGEVAAIAPGLDERRAKDKGVNFDGIQGEALVALGGRMGIDFTLLADDPGPGFGWKLPLALPATFIVNPDGDLVETRFGPQTEEDIRALIGG